MDRLGEPLSGRAKKLIQAHKVMIEEIFARNMNLLIDAEKQQANMVHYYYWGRLEQAFDAVDHKIIQDLFSGLITTFGKVLANLAIAF